MVLHCFLVGLFFLDLLAAQWDPLHQLDTWKQRKSEREKRCVVKSKNKRREKGRGGGKRRREEEEDMVNSRNERR